jgi:hypothetical protein
MFALLPSHESLVSSGVEDIVKLALASVRSIKNGESPVESLSTTSGSDGDDSLTGGTKEIPQSGESNYPE